MDDKTYQQELEIPVTMPPKRVVSLVPSITESLFDLDLGGRLVGITEYCIYPTEKVAELPKVGGTKNPDIQQIIDLKPDLVFANQEENNKADVEALQEAGIMVWVTFPKTVQDALNLLWNIMYAFEHTVMSPRVRVIEASYDWVNAISEAREEDNPCKVFVPIWKDPLMTFNQHTYIHDLLRVCGGQNIFADRDRQYPLSVDLGESEALALDSTRVEGRDTRYPRITLAEIEARQPDVILLPSEPYVFTEADISMFDGLDVPAVKHKRIHLVDGSLLTWHGTRLAYALNDIPQLMCSEE